MKGIGRSAFSGCHDLKYSEYDNALYLGNEENPYLVLITAKDELIASIAINSATKLIYSDAFSYCTSLTSVTIPDGVTSIGQFAFAFCALTAVTIPNSVRNIGANTFYGCTPLENITYSGTVEQWRELTTQCCRWARHCPCEVVKCKDGEVPVTEHDRVSIYDLEFDIEEPDGDEEE